MDVIIKLIICVFLMSLDSSGHLRAYECLDLSGCSIISLSSRHPLQNNDLKAQVMASEINPWFSNSITRSGKSNVIISEPVNCTDGKDILGVCSLHDQNFSGNNITIAIIDIQFYVDRLSERELPKERILLSGGKFSDHEIHGTACAEIIGDIAPNAALYIAGIEDSNEYGFKETTDKLLNLNKRIDIVSCSMDFPSGQFDKREYFCSIVRNFTKNGTFWINAVGDEAKRHWYGAFKDEDGNGFHEFDPGDEALKIALERGMPLKVWLSWNDSWTKAEQDFDLYIFAPDGSYTISKDSQNGYEGQKPVEAAEMIAPVRGNYSIKIKKYNASQNNATFQLFTNVDLLSHNIESFSIGALASCPEVLTIGAVDASTMELENYSSMGPTIDGRIKPDLVAPDNVTTSSYLTEKFKGSSASVPYAAGIFALALEKGRKFGMSDAEIERMLLDSAIDLGPQGADTGYGHGLINLHRFAKLKEDSQV